MREIDGGPRVTKKWSSGRVVHEEHDAGRYAMVFDASGYEKLFETKMKRKLATYRSSIFSCPHTV